MFYSFEPQEAFFWIPLDKGSQFPFAFTLKEQKSKTQQLTWTALPQWFRDSLYFFAQALAWDLEDLYLKEGLIKQYVGDLLICLPTQEPAKQHGKALWTS